MPYFTIRVADRDTSGNPGVRFFVDGDAKVIKNHIVLFERTIFVAEKNINSLLEIVLREPREIEDFFNKKHQRQYTWHVDKKKLNIKNTLELPYNIRDYKLKTVGVAISQSQDSNGINGNIVILYTENGKNYPAEDFAHCTLDKLVNEIEFNLHIKFVEESIENYRNGLSGGGVANQLAESCRLFREALNSRCFRKALLVADQFKVTNELPDGCCVSEGEEIYKKYRENNTRPILTQATQRTVSPKTKDDEWQVVESKKKAKKMKEAPRPTN